MSEAINIDPNDLTLDEIELVEDTLGLSIDTAFSTGTPKAKALKTLVWVMMRRDDPEVTIESVGSLKLTDINLGE